MVTPNVETFLRLAQQTCRLHESASTESRSEDILVRNDLFWIDAICINQRDNHERTTQVAIMRKLYEKANSIAIWLGEPGTDTRRAFDFFKTSAWKTRTVTRTAKEEGLIARSVTDLLERLYCRRSWVLQEATTPKVSKVVVCGDLRIRLDTMLNPEARASLTALGEDQVFALKQAYNNVLMPLQALTEARSGMFTSKRADPHNLLSHVRRLQATDPRDKLFAPLQLAEDQDLFRQDYTISEVNLYQEFAIRLITKTRNLDILAYLGRNASMKGEELALPSWTPDWRGSAPVPFPRANIKAGAHTSLWFSDNGILLSRDPTLAALDERLVQNLRSGKLILQAIHVGTLGGHAGYGPNAAPADEWELRDGRAVFDFSLSKGFEQCLRKHYAKNITPAFTLAPDFAQNGDEIYTVFGARYPLILRKSDRGRDLLDNIGRSWSKLRLSSVLPNTTISSKESPNYTVLGEAHCQKQSFVTSNNVVVGAANGSDEAMMKWLWGDEKLKFRWGLPHGHLCDILAKKYGATGIATSKLIREIEIS